MNAETLLRRLLAEIKIDNGSPRSYDGNTECFWCGKSAGNLYEDVVGFTWHALDCAYLAAHLHVTAADRTAELKDGFARIADLAAKDGDA